MILFLTGCLLLAEPPDFTCSNEFDCPGSDGACDDGVCVDAECDYDDPCPPGNVCIDRLCYRGCQFDDDCGGDDVCLSDYPEIGDCVECEFDFQCPGNQTCRNDNTCR